MVVRAAEYIFSNRSTNYFSAIKKLLEKDNQLSCESLKSQQIYIYDKIANFKIEDYCAIPSNELVEKVESYLIENRNFKEIINEQLSKSQNKILHLKRAFIDFKLNKCSTYDIQKQFNNMFDADPVLRANYLFNSTEAGVETKLNQMLEQTFDRNTFPTYSTYNSLIDKYNLAIEPVFIGATWPELRKYLAEDWSIIYNEKIELMMRVLSIKWPEPNVITFILTLLCRDVDAEQLTQTLTCEFPEFCVSFGRTMASHITSFELIANLMKITHVRNDQLYHQTYLAIVSVSLRYNFIHTLKHNPMSLTKEISKFYSGSSGLCIDLLNIHRCWFAFLLANKALEFGQLDETHSALLTRNFINLLEHFSSTSFSTALSSTLLSHNNELDFIDLNAMYLVDHAYILLDTFEIFLRIGNNKIEFIRWLNEFYDEVMKPALLSRYEREVVTNLKAKNFTKIFDTKLVPINKTSRENLQKSVLVDNHLTKKYINDSTNLPFISMQYCELVLTAVQRIAGFNECPH